MNRLEIKPLGWIALVSVIGIILYFWIKRRRQPPRDNQAIIDGTHS